MAKYVELEKIFEIWKDDPSPTTIASLVNAIHKAPKADARLAGYGRWKADEFGCFCDKCKFHSLYSKSGKIILSNFCPQCGADMREE